MLCKFIFCVCHIIKLQVSFFKRNQNTQGKAISPTPIPTKWWGHKTSEPKPDPPPVGSHSRCTPVNRPPHHGRPDSPRTSSGRNTGPGTPLRPAAPTRCRSHGSPCTSSGRRGTSSQMTAPYSLWFLQENRTPFVKQNFLYITAFFFKVPMSHVQIVHLTANY